MGGRGDGAHVEKRKLGTGRGHRDREEKEKEEKWEKCVRYDEKEECMIKSKVRITLQFHHTNFCSKISCLILIYVSEAVILRVQRHDVRK